MENQKNKIFWNKLKQGGNRLVHWKLPTLLKKPKKKKKIHIKRKTSHVFGLDDNIVKIIMLPNVHHRTNTMNIKILMVFSVQMEKIQNSYVISKDSE